MQAWLERVAEMFDAAFISGDRWKLYLQGLGVTLQIAAFAAILGMIIGTILAFMQVSSCSKPPLANHCLRWFLHW